MMSRVVLITGASSGIGYATALAFAREGYHVAGTARNQSSLEPLEQNISSIPHPHGQLLKLEVDVRDKEAVEHAVQQTVNQFGRLDILVANAGVGLRGTVVDTEWSDMETLLRTNIDGVLHSIRAAVPEIKKQDNGQIVLVSSVAFNMTAPYAACYAASKAFVSSIARSLRVELSQYNINVIDMIVGRTDTNFDKNRLGGQRRESSLPTMTPEQVAEGIVKAVKNRKQTVTLRFFDSLTIFGNKLFPGLVGWIATKQYK